MTMMKVLSITTHATKEFVHSFACVQKSPFYQDMCHFFAREAPTQAIYLSQARG